MPNRFGATPEEWEHFDVTLGLTEDLLPVVSDPSFKISPNSTLKAIGKVPSMLNKSNEITGFSEWTKYTGTAEHVTQWQTVHAYGICVQTRYARAIDVDTEDADLARKIYEYLEGWGLPCRARPNSPKFLLCFTQPGKLQKRVIKMASGIIEFLANGQQFIAAGTHTSGVRYEWVDGLPEEIPPVSLIEFEVMWKGLQDTFGVGAATGAAHHNEPRREQTTPVLSQDTILHHLEQTGQVLSTGKEGEAFITCPFAAEHTQEDGGTGTVYYPAGSRGYEQGHFKCLHAHCAGRSDAEFLEGVKYGGAWFEPLPAEAVPEDDLAPKPKERFELIQVGEYAERKYPGWLIKHVIPKAELVVLFGASEGGKSFIAIDMAMAIARGTSWQGHKTKQGRTVYLCAEGNGGFPKRLKAYGIQNNINLKTLPMQVIEDIPNFIERDEIVKAIKKIKAQGPADFVTVDTMAQSMPGGDENSGESVSKVISNCKLIHRATGALVMLVHHTGKDLTKGARGWSGLRASADAELELAYDKSLKKRTLYITKQKDGDGSLVWDVKLNQIVVDTDEDNEAITSCTVTLTPTVETTPKPETKGEYQRALEKAFDDLGGFSAQVNAILTKAAPLIPHDPQKRDQRRANLRQALSRMIDREFFILTGDTVERKI